ncbi:MAG: DUF359 domain-containing protein, partial [Thermoplasmatota archaeon]
RVVTRSAVREGQDATRGARRVVVEVVGEEDLAALPAILAAPAGAVVAYGQPNQGVVCVVVDDASRARARDLLSRMEKV